MQVNQPITPKAAVYPLLGKSYGSVCLCVFAVLLAVTSLVVNWVLHHILLWSNIISGDWDKAMGCKQSDLIERGLIHSIT